MKESKSKENSHIDRLINNLVGYVDTQFKLIQLEVKQEISNAITLLIVVLILGIFVGLAGLLLSFALAMYIGSLLGGLGWGFLILGVVYIAIAAGLASQFKGSFIRKSNK